MVDFTGDRQLLLMGFWLAVAAIWGYSTCRILIENRQIRDNSPTLPTMHYILNRLAGLQRRNLQLWFLVSLLLGILAANGINGLVQVPPAPVTIVTQSPAPAPTEAAKQEQPAAKPPETGGSAIPATNAMPFSDITEFNEKDSRQQAMIDWLKQRYENWLITYYYLHKCGMADKADFDLIRLSLKQELAKLNTDTTSVEDNILLAANGSYNELYATASCDDERSKVTLSSYEAYMATVRGANTPASLKTQEPASAPAAAAPATQPAEQPPAEKHTSLPAATKTVPLER